MKAIIVAVCAVSVFCVVTIPADVKATGAVAGTADNSTGQSPKLKAERDLNSQQRRGIATIEFDADNNTEIVYKTLPAVVATILNAAKVAITDSEVETTAETTTGSSDATTASVLRPVRRRRRATDDGRYSEDGIGLVDVDPAVKDDKLRVALFAQDRDGKVLAAAELKGKLKEDERYISEKTGHKVSSVYPGMPEDTREPLQKRATVWDLHWNMFLAILVLTAIAIFTLIVCCLCFYCCKRRKLQATSNNKSEKPLADEQMVELTPIIPLQSAPQQQLNKPNGNEEQPLADDDNGWIVPIDQLSPDELEQPAGVQISRL